MMGRVLALDAGEKRVGVAITDALNITAQGLEVIERKNEEAFLDRLKSLIKEYSVSKIVIGMPLNMNGTKGSSAKLVEDFVELLKKDIPVDIETLDERLTTKQGERMLLEADISRKKRKLSIDKISAQLILQTYLDLYAQKDKP